MTTYTDRNQWPIPDWNAEWQAWQQKFREMMDDVDATVFGNTEASKDIFYQLPNADIYDDSGTKKLRLYTDLILVSRTQNIKLTVDSTNDLVLIPYYLIGAVVTPGLVEEGTTEFELYGSTPIDPGVQIFGYVTSTYQINWWNGSTLAYGDAARQIFSFIGTGGGGDTVKVSVADTTSNYLSNKLVEGTGITLTILNPGANETLEISSSAVGYWDRTAGAPGYLNPLTVTDTIRAGSGSVSQPGVAGYVYDDTGIYWSSGDKLNVASGGVDVLAMYADVDGQKIEFPADSDQSYIRKTFDGNNYHSILNIESEATAINPFGAKININSIGFGSGQAVQVNLSSTGDTCDSLIKLYTESNSTGGSSHIDLEAVGGSDVDIILYANNNGGGSAGVTISSNGNPGFVAIGSATTDVIRLTDINEDGSSIAWSNAYMEFSSASSEWDDFDSNFGEVSLLSALNTAYSGDATLAQSAVGYGSASNKLTGDASVFYYSLISKGLFLGDDTPEFADTYLYSLFLEGRLEVCSTSYFKDDIRIYNGVNLIFEDGVGGLYSHIAYDDGGIQIYSFGGNISFHDSYMSTSGSGDFITLGWPVASSSAEIASIYSLLGSSHGSIAAAILAAAASGGSPALTQYAIGYGNASNLITGDATNFRYDYTNRVVHVGSGSMDHITPALHNDSLYVEGRLEVDGNVYFDNDIYVLVNKALRFNSTSYLQHNTSLNAFVMTTGGIAGNKIVFNDYNILNSSYSAYGWELVASGSTGSTEMTNIYSLCGSSRGSIAAAILAAAASGGSPALTQYAIGYGNASNLITGDATNFRYDYTNRVVRIGDGTPAQVASTNDSLYVEGKLEVHSQSYFDQSLYVAQSKPIVMGTSYSGFIYFVDALRLLSLGSTESGSGVSFYDYNVINNGWSSGWRLTASGNPGYVEMSNIYSLCGSTYGSIAAAILAASQTGGTTSLTNHYVGYGNASNQLDGNAYFTYYSGGENLVALNIGGGTHKTDLTVVKPTIAIHYSAAASMRKRIMDYNKETYGSYVDEELLWLHGRFFSSGNYDSATYGQTQAFDGIHLCKKTTSTSTVNLSLSNSSSAYHHLDEGYAYLFKGVVVGMNESTGDSSRRTDYEFSVLAIHTISHGIVIDILSEDSKYNTAGTVSFDASSDYFRIRVTPSTSDAINWTGHIYCGIRMQHGYNLGT